MTELEDRLEKKTDWFVALVSNPKTRFVLSIIFLIILAFFVYLFYANIDYIRNYNPCEVCMNTTGAKCYIMNY